MKNRHLVAFALTFGMAVSSLTGCGSDTGEPTAKAPTRSPELFYEIVESNLWQLDAGMPMDLAQALPNRTIWSTGAGGERVEEQFSNAVIAGQVVKVEPLRAKLWIDAEEEKYEPADFDDPNASSREVSVTMKVTDALGVEETDGHFTFSIGVIGGGVDDPYAYMESLRGLGDVVVVLKRSEHGSDKGEYRPTMAAGLIGQIAEDGSLSFPALGEHEKEFVGGLGTLEALFAEAKEPPVMVDIESEYAKRAATEEEHDH